MTAKEEKRRNSLSIPMGDEPKAEAQQISTTESMQLLTAETLAQIQSTAAMQETIRG